MDEIIKTHVPCLFCQTPLQKNKTDRFKARDIIKCKSCGRKNNWEEAVKKQGEKVAKEKIHNIFKDAFKK